MAVEAENSGAPPSQAAQPAPKKAPFIWVPPLLGFLDINKDGKITKEEFSNGYPDLMFPLLDTDKDEKISLKEYTEAVKKARENAQKDYESMAKNLDKDEDGFLSEEEWKSTEKDRGEADANKDGKISIKEYANYRMKGWYHLLLPRTTASAQGKVTLFDAVDKNRDGKITREEMKEAAGEFFLMWDYNGDGVINPLDATEAAKRKKASKSAEKEKEDDSGKAQNPRP